MANANINPVGSYLVNLPIELWEYVLDDVKSDASSARTIRSLSRTCRSFFDLFKNEHYNIIVLRADERSGRSIQRIGSGPRAPLVKKLIFRARDPRPAWERRNDTRFRLSIPSKQVLTLLFRFPNLIEFELDVDWKLDLWFSAHPEPRLYPMNGYSETYRVILDDTLRALGRSVHHNRARPLPKLTIRRLPPRTYRALADHGLHALLNSVRDFHIDLHSEVHSFPISMSHYNFIANISPYFLHHLTNLRTLHLQSARVTPIGEIPGIPRIDFSTIHLPLLRKLTLSHFIIGPETDKFFTRHLGTLNTITLSDCYRDHSWSSLFRSIIAKKPSKLTDFIVSLPELGYPVETSPRNFKIVYHPLWEELDAEAGKRIFRRVRIFMGVVSFWCADEVEEFRDGGTLLLWARLQRLVGKNRGCWERFESSRTEMR